MSEPILTEAERARLRRAMPPEYDAPVVEGVFEAILAARLAPVEAERWQDRCQRTGQALTQALSELDEARANRDRLAQDNAALRQEVADLTAERDEAQRQLDIVSHQAVQIRDEREFRIRERNRAKGRAEAAERARDEVIARVRALAEEWERNAMQETVGVVKREALAVVHELRAALDGPAPQPEEVCPTCPTATPGKGCTTAWCADDPTPPTTDAEEANDA